MMNDETRFDVEAVFDAGDYHYFYDLSLTPERTEREVDLIWRLLDLRAGMRVCDLACGHGRIANRLAARGCNVTGLDITEAFLREARQEAADLGLAVDYVRGDMRSLPWTDTFDAIVNWFTAFGYFDDDGNRAVLAEVYRALHPGGQFLVELNNRDWLLKQFQHASAVERDGNMLVDRMRYDVLTGRLHVERTAVRDGHVRHMHFFMRLLTYPEIREWLRQIGFRSVTGYDQDGDALALESRRMIVVAEK